MRVPAGHVIRYAYVSLDSFGGFVDVGGVHWPAVVEYAGKYAALGDDQDADCPWVEWDDGRWRVSDGRKRLLAMLGVGYRVFLVRWMERVRPGIATTAEPL